MAAIATGIGDVGADVSTGGGMEAELGATLSAGWDAAEAEAPGGEGGSPESLPTSPAEDTPPGEAPTSLDAQPKEQPQQVEQPQDTPTGSPETATWKLSPDGKTYMMPKAEFPRVQSAMQYADAVGQFFSTPQDAQLAASQAADLRTMANDWVYGTDDTIRSVLSHWAGANHGRNPAMQQAFQRSFSRMMTMAPEILKGINPAAHQQFVRDSGKALVNSLYEKAANTGNPQDLQDAQAVDWGLTGQYQKELPKADPQAQARAQFEQQQREFNTRQDAAMRRDVTNFSNQAVEGAKMAQLGQKIDALLSNVKDKYNPIAYEDLKAGIHRELIDTISKQDWFTEHKQNYDQLMSDYRTSWQQGYPGQGLQPRVQAYVQDFMSRANRVLPSIAQKRVNATTASVTAHKGRSVSPATGTPNQTRPATQPPAQNGKPNPPARMSSDQWDSEWRSMFK